MELMDLEKKFRRKLVGFFYVESMLFVALMTGLLKSAGWTVAGVIGGLMVLVYFGFAGLISIEKLGLAWINRGNDIRPFIDKTVSKVIKGKSMKQIDFKG